MNLTELAGVVLLSGWLLVLCEYCLRRHSIRHGLHSAKYHCRKGALKITDTLLVVFYFSELLVNIAWIIAGAMCVAKHDDVLSSANASRSFLVTVCIFLLGALTWPIFISNYTTPISFPGMEEVCMAITALGAVAMAAVAGHNRGDGSGSASYALLAATCYMAFHYIFFDLIGWSYVRSCIACEMRKNSKFCELMLEDWTPSSTVMQSTRHDFPSDEERNTSVAAVEKPD